MNEDLVDLDLLAQAKRLFATASQFPLQYVAFYERLNPVVFVLQVRLYADLPSFLVLYFACSFIQMCHTHSQDTKEFLGYRMALIA